MRRAAALLALAAALVSAASAAAGLEPIRRDRAGELGMPRVRAGTLRIPPGHAQGRVRVIARLKLAPLAEAFAARYAATGGAGKLNVSNAGSQAYLARLARAQSVAVATLKREIPEAAVGRRFRILVNGLALDLPARRLPALARMPFVTRIYPSVGYTQLLNRSPGIIAASALSAATGAHGAGVKIGVVDDGVDERSPFFSPNGYAYPDGFPKGGRTWTTPKVIVARAFPGPGSGARGRLAVDRRASFHGTHVAGIAAGNSGTSSTGGRDHQPVSGLSGVAPKAWIGNYRVFTVPSPVGNVADSPEIVAGFEAAVRDGMDVINFSGGSPQFDPQNDILHDAVRNVAAAGVVPVISAGNDRDEFGLGSHGSPGTAPDAISVAAASNLHVFAPKLSLVGPGIPANVQQLPFRASGGQAPPHAWGTFDQTLVDVGSIVGTDGRPVDRKLCGPSDNANGGRNPLPRGSLTNAIALVSRGDCALIVKALRVQEAGARGLVVVDNRSGEPNAIPLVLPVPSGMVADLDGERLRAVLIALGGRAPARVESAPSEIQTGRSGIVTSFSSAGPTAFGHLLKPDLTAPGGEILSATLPEFAGAPFASFDGTSMSAPHAAGAAALLVERHQGWSPRQVKSALMSTAGPAWGNTARTSEAPVLLQGSGLINVHAADDPKVFTDPMSLSFGDLNVNGGAVRRPLALAITDAGGGAGTWLVQLIPQTATGDASLQLPSSFSLAPGGTLDLVIAAQAGANAPAGDNYGWVILRRGTLTRRIPYAFFVTRPALEKLTPIPLRAVQIGDTRQGVSNASVYRFPAAPFGPPPNYTGPPVVQEGAERLYYTQVAEPAANVGVAVISSSAGASIDPWFLGSADENDVQGYAGTPVNVNPLSLSYRVPTGAAGAMFPRQKRYFVSVDSGRDQFTGRSYAGSYLLNAWINDVFPPLMGPVTTRVAAGRPTLVMRTFDLQAGVDPYSLVVGYGRVLVAAAVYDPFSGYAVFPLPPAAPKLRAGRRQAIFLASDYQEAKNSDITGRGVLPNTSFLPVQLRVVNGPAVTWLTPERGECTGRQGRLLVVASATRPIRFVRFFDGRRRIATVRRAVAGLYAATWRTGKARKGRHRLRAVVVTAGARATAVHPVRVCR